jgi:hypothetical protein
VSTLLRLATNGSGCPARRKDTAPQRGRVYAFAPDPN